MKEWKQIHRLSYLFNRMNALARTNTQLWMEKKENKNVVRKKSDKRVNERPRKKAKNHNGRIHSVNIYVAMSKCDATFSKCQTFIIVFSFSSSSSSSSLSSVAFPNRLFGSHVFGVLLYVALLLFFFLRMIVLLSLR